MLEPEIKRGAVLLFIQTFTWILFIVQGVLIAKGDFKNQKIAHKHLWFGFRWVMISYFMMISASVLGHFGHVAIYYKAPFYQALAVHIFASVTAAMAMWFARIWPAGDAKLFMLLALFYPMMNVGEPFFSGFLFMFVLINIFTPAVIMVFARAVKFVWKSRLQHLHHFLKNLGPQREFDYFREKTLAVGRRALTEMLEWTRWITDSPKEFLGEALRFALMGVAMSVFSFATREIVASPLARTLMCFAMIFVWAKIEDALEQRMLWFLIVMIPAGIYFSYTDGIWEAMITSFLQISLFGIFLYLGMRWTIGAVQGEIVLIALPLVFMALGVLPWMYSKLTGVPIPGWLPTRLLSIWAFLGFFFGLSFVFVKIWEDEDHPTLEPEKLVRAMVLHPKTLKVIKQDPDFYDEHFDTNYADGMTPDQTDALKEWCAEHGIERVPISTTVSFAMWIFLGYLITWFLRGHVLAPIYS